MRQNLLFSFVLLVGCSSAEDQAVIGTGAGQAPGSGGSAALDDTDTGGSSTPTEAAGGSGMGTGGIARGDSGVGGQSGTMGNTRDGSTAGSTGVGGAAGSDAAVVVRPCKDLPAVGSWEFISPIEFRVPTNMEAYAVAINPHDQTVYATAGNKTDGGNGGTGVMKSIDCGATWSLASTGANGDKLKTGGLWALIVDPKNSETLYVANGYGNNPTIYKSSNGGTDFTALNPDPGHALANTVNFVQAIALDPRDPTHLAITFHDSCKAPHAPLCFSQSPDGGFTWQVFDGPTSIPGWTINGWEEGASITVLGASSYLFTAGAGIWYTGNGGAQWSQVVGQYIAGSYGGTNHIGPDGSLYIGGNNVFVSPAAPASDPPFALATGKKPTALANSPSATVIIDDGVSLFASLTPSTNARAFWTAPLASPTAWIQMPDKICHDGNVPSGSCRGSNAMTYDSAHHIIYSANWGAGLWRLVTR